MHGWPSGMPGRDKGQEIQSSRTAATYSLATGLLAPAEDVGAGKAAAVTVPMTMREVLFKVKKVVTGMPIVHF